LGQYTYFSNGREKCIDRFVAACVMQAINTYSLDTFFIDIQVNGRSKLNIGRNCMDDLLIPIEVRSHL
jgi:hypothetical protein